MSKKIPDITVEIAKAPADWTAVQVLTALQLDPFQSRVSQNPIPLTHPRTGKQAYLKEYAEDILSASRFAIQAEDYLIFVSRLTNSAIGTIFKAMKIVPLREIEKFLAKRESC